MPTILILDDDHELFGLLNEYLQDEGFICVHAAEPETGLSMAGKNNYDGIILDVMLPGMNGFEVLRLLRSEEKTHQVPVIMLTARGEEVDRIVGLEMGADDYLAKPFSPRELVARLRALMRRSPAYRAEHVPAVQVIGDIRIDRNSSSVFVDETRHQLTAPEMRLLVQLVLNAGKVIPRAQLYDSIFGRPAGPGDRSLDMLVSRLRKKMGPAPDGGERLKAVRGEGYMFLRMEPT